MRKSFIMTVGACLLTTVAFADLPQYAQDSVTKRCDKGTGAPLVQQQAAGPCVQPCLYFEDFEGADFVVGSNILGQGAAGGIFETWAVGCGGSLTGSIVSDANPFGGAGKHLRLQKDPVLPTTPAGGCIVAARVPANAIAEANTPPIGPTTVSHEISISASGGSNFNTQPQARWQGFLTARVLYFYLGQIYALDILPGLATTFGFVGNWDTTGAYQHLDIALDPCSNFHCDGGVAMGLACTSDADCVGDGGAILDGACLGRIHYDYGNGAAVYDGIAGFGQNVDQFLVYSDNFSEFMDVDNVEIVRGDPCPSTCGAEGIEPGEECETDDDSPCPGKCVQPGGTGPNGEPPCTCVIQNADPCDAYPIENDVAFNKTAHGGWFTFTASAPAYAAETCGTPNYDSQLSVWTGTCDSLTLIALNDDCYDGPDYGAGSDPLASCYNGPLALAFPFNACLCAGGLTLGQQYWIYDDRIAANPVGSTINLLVSKRQDCGALWGDAGACCHGLTGVCEDNVPQSACGGQFDTFTLRKSCGTPEAGECVQVTGACCSDPVNGVCVAGVPQSACPAPGVWTPNGSCTAVCAPHLGACCDTNTGTCTDGVLLVDCTGEGLVWTDGAACSTIECESAAIPTVSEWGLVIMTLLLLAGAKVYFGRRREVLA